MSKNLAVLACCLVALAIPGVALGQICSHCHDVHGPDVGVHHGGVARCNICHTMHNSEDGTHVDVNHPAGNPHLLRQSNSTDVCLVCHAGHIGNVLGSDPMNPPTEIGAGNFVFLLEDNLNDGYQGSLNPIPGDAAGHNIVSPANNISADATLSSAPGGSFPSGSLACTSCHDPHGNVNFRMLYGAGQVAQGGTHVFSNPAPVAQGLSIYHGRERDTKHTAYQSGMSEWCGNCHEEFLDSHPGERHLTQALLGAEIAAIYNAYNGTEDPFGGALGSSYLAAVPFQDLANTLTSTTGPSAASQMMCLTCHRAHASSAPDAGRWDFAVTHLESDGDESGSYPLPNPYGSLSQRSLCNKCHAKDFDDLLVGP